MKSLPSYLFLVLVFYLLFCSFVVCQSEQNETSSSNIIDPYATSGAPSYLAVSTVVNSDQTNDGLQSDDSQGNDGDNEEDHFQFYTWEQKIVIKKGSCSSSNKNTTITWSPNTPVCNGTSYLACFPSWDGKVKFKDLAPEGSTPTFLEFRVYGSFGCGGGGYVNYTLNGDLLPLQYLSSPNCGCLSDADISSPISLDVNSTTELKYYRGDWNEFVIVPEEIIDLCVCGVSVVGTYYGDQPPLDPGNDNSHWVAWLFASLGCLVVAAIIIAGIVFYVIRKRRNEFEVESFDTEFTVFDDKM